VRRRQALAVGRSSAPDSSEEERVVGDKDTQMIGPIRDCACVIAGGMGRGAYAHIRAAGLRAVVTTLSEIDEAALECASGRIVDHVESLH
jgi:hypothetical protein